MNKQIAKELNEHANTVAKRFSNTNRDGNVNAETFWINEIISMSDHTATVVFEKSSGKFAAAFFYYIAKGYSKGWKYFFPTDSHINGLASFHFFKLEVERKNFDKNF
jgi:hypothetical protein